MKQSEKSKRSYEKILSAAIEEFGTKSYENASINTICSENSISKGLIYHNFKNKDELYLCCVEACFNAFKEFLNQAQCSEKEFNTYMKKNLDLRYQFFQENTYFSNIFFNTVLQPPKHLVKQIKEIRKEFDEYNSMQFRHALEGIALRDTITTEEAMEYFFIFQEMFNGYFQSKAYENADFHSLIEDHEMKLSKILNIMLYGLAKEENNNDSLHS